MKRCIALLLVFAGCICLTGCTKLSSWLERNVFTVEYEDYFENSLTDYAEHKSRYSPCSLNAPKFFTPSFNFLKEYPYVDGTYVWRADGARESRYSDIKNATDIFPEITLLVVTYDEQTYFDAKQYMLERIQPYDDTRYTYGSYVFYENAYYREEFSTGVNGRGFPQKGTVAGYNDEKRILVFLGICTSTWLGCCLPDIYLNDIENNWESFIDTYYGQYYDFSE